MDEQIHTYNQCVITTKRMTDNCFTAVVAEHQGYIGLGSTRLNAQIDLIERLRIARLITSDEEIFGKLYVIERLESDKLWHKFDVRPFLSAEEANEFILKHCTVTEELRVVRLDPKKHQKFPRLRVVHSK